MKIGKVGGADGGGRAIKKREVELGWLQRNMYKVE